MNKTQSKKIEVLSKIKLPQDARNLLNKIEKALASNNADAKEKANTALDNLYNKVKQIAAKQQTEDKGQKVSEKAVVPKSSDIDEPAQKEEIVEVVNKVADPLQDAIESDPALKGFNRKATDVLRDAARPAMTSGRRVSRKGWKNQYGESKGGRVYYESRENRMDRKAPITRTTKMPWLEDGGHLDGMDFEVVEIMDGNEKIVLANQTLSDAKVYAMVKRHMGSECDYMVRDGNGMVYYSSNPNMFAKGGYMAKGGEVKGDSLENVRKDAKILSSNSKGNFYLLEEKRYEFLNENDKTIVTKFTIANEEDVDYIKEMPKNKLVVSYKILGRYSNGDLKSSEQQVIYSNNAFMAEGGYMAKGGTLKVIKDSDKNQGRLHYERFEEAIGSFAWIIEGKYNEGILYPLDEFDRKYYSHLKLKEGEMLFRYKTERTMIGMGFPLIKINLDKMLVYFLENSDDDKNPTFNSRGTKLDYLVIEEAFYNVREFAKGGIVVTSIKDIPNFQERLDEGKITYRGLGIGKLYNNFYDVAGESGYRIKVDGKEYYITETEFNSFSRGSDGKLRVKFDAPYRKFEDGGVLGQSDFDSLKKGDKISITFSSPIKRENEAQLMVKSKTLVNKGKRNEKEKITFVNLANPSGVKFYGYKDTDDNYIGFAIGDLAIYNVKKVSKMEEGGTLEDSTYLARMAEEYAEREYGKKVKPTSTTMKASKLPNGKNYYTEITVVFTDGSKQTFEQKDFEEFFDVDDYAKGGELAMGIKTEMEEHGMGKAEATKTAKDHLRENSKYYSKMKAAGLEHGGSVEFFDYSNADLEKLPYKLDKYFTKPAGTVRIPLDKIKPIRAREKGVKNANKFMRDAYDGKMEKREPITVYKSAKKGHYILKDGNSTYANAKFSGWKDIYAVVVKNEKLSTSASKTSANSVLTLAKKIRKEGEKWQDAIQRAKKMRNESTN
jgi:hypothetical protein